VKSFEILKRSPKFLELFAEFNRECEFHRCVFCYLPTRNILGKRRVEGCDIPCTRLFLPTL